MSSQNIIRAPAVKWAQRAEVILLTIELEDIHDPKIDIKDKNISFSCIGGIGKQEPYAFSLDTYGGVTSEGLKQNRTDKHLEMVIRKAAEEQPACTAADGEKHDHPHPHPHKAKPKFWPRLHKEGKKPHYLGTNFNKWKDEDDEDDTDWNNPYGGGDGDGDMPGMAGMPGMPGMPGMGGMGGMGMEDMNDYMSKMGAMGGMGGMGGEEPPAGDSEAKKGSSSDDSDDEKLPDLE